MPFRSVLFTPATKLDRLAKALAAGPDRVVLDLEDGVAPSEKNNARQYLSDLSDRRFEGRADRLGVRINSLSTPDGVRDMSAMLDWPHWPAMLVLPKVETPIQIRQIIALAASRGSVPALLVALETARGIENAHEILRSAPAGTAVGYGSADHMAETGGDMSPASLAWARGRIVNAAAAAGLPAFDGVWLRLDDVDGLRDEARLVKSMGFAGKIAIHPDQIDPINAVFTPSDAEVETARDMLAAFEAAGGSAFSFRGKMIDAPVVARARRMIQVHGKEQT